ncbi:MAG: hypothetical protein ACI8WB_006270, partial [Phenylobacterium sp.]
MMTTDDIMDCLADKKLEITYGEWKEHIFVINSETNNGGGKDVGISFKDNKIPQDGPIPRDKAVNSTVRD